MYSEAPAVTASGSTSTLTALVKAIVLPAVYRANLEFQLHVPSCTRIIDSRTCGRRGLCTLVHSFMRAMGSNMRLRKAIVVQKPDRVLNAT